MKKFYDYMYLLERTLKQLPRKVFTDIRFELPKTNLSVERNRTIIFNFSEIATAIHRDPQHMFKFLLRELGTAGNIDKHRAILQGKFLNTQIDAKIELYVNEFVTCPECKKPDTKIVKIDRFLFLKCMACGARHSLKHL
jgi:translation initiation factor 2 subunit 2